MNILPRHLLILTLFFVCWAAPSLAAFRVAVGEESAQLMQVEENRLVGRIGGLYQCVFDRTGLAFDFISMPIKRAVFQLENHQVDVVIPLAELAGRDEFADFGGALVYAEYVYVSLKALPEIRATPGVRFVLLRGFAGNRFVHEQVQAPSDPPPLEVSSWQQVSGVLEMGRADVTVMPRQDVSAIQADPVYTQPAGRIPASLYVSRVPENQSLLTALQAGVHTCHGEFAEQLRDL